MRILAIDFGLKRLGVAVSDEGGQLARPLKVISVSTREALLSELGNLVREFTPAEIVVGHPRRLHGGPGTLAPVVEDFAAQLHAKFGVRVVLWDERLTTLAAEEKLKEAGARRRKRREKVDQAAAAVILQDYLDTKRDRERGGH